MYDYLEGILAHKGTDITKGGGETFVTLEIGGIGYRVGVLKGIEESIGASSGQLKLYIHYQKTDDSVFLYGFLERAERDFFKRLISVSGIGASFGLRILSGMSYRQMIGIIIREDKERLLQISGLGPKTAGKIFLELKDKIKDFEVFSAAERSTSVSTSSDLVFEAKEALIALGYRETEIYKAIDLLKKESSPPKDLESFLRRTLALLSSSSL